MLGLLIAITGALVGAVSTYIVSLLLRPRKIIEFSTSSISLLRLNPQAESVVSITVKKSILTGNESDEEETVSLKSVYGFQVNLFNVGNEDIDKLDDIEIRFDKSAKIIKCETEPIATKSYMIGVQKDTQQNICHVSLPYFNKHEQLVIKLITTENEDSSCFVKAHGLGVITRRIKVPNILIKSYLAFVIPALVIVIALAIIDAAIHKFAYPYFIDTHDPFSIIGWGLLFIIYVSMLIYLYINSKANKYREISQDWDWELPEN